MRQIYRTRTEIKRDILELFRIWMGRAEEAALCFDYPKCLHCFEAAKRWAAELEPTPRSPRSLADGGFNTDGVRGK